MYTYRVTATSTLNGSRWVEIFGCECRNDADRREQAERFVTDLLAHRDEYGCRWKDIRMERAKEAGRFHKCRVPNLRG